MTPDLIVGTAWSAVLIICITWRDIRHRQARMIERCAELEHGQQQRPVGFRKADP